jgi:hypothetical protein
MERVFSAFHFVSYSLTRLSLTLTLTFTCVGLFHDAAMLYASILTIKETKFIQQTEERVEKL